MSASNLVYIANIVDIALLYDIELIYIYIAYLKIPCLHHSLCWHLNLVRYRIKNCQHSLSQTTFTSFTSSTSLRCTISNQHRVDIAYIRLPCVHRSYRHHRNVVRYRINICVDITNIVDIAILLDAESISCGQCFHNMFLLLPWHCSVARSSLYKFLVTTYF